MANALRVAPTAGLGCRARSSRGARMGSRKTAPRSSPLTGVRASACADDEASASALREENALLRNQVRDLIAADGALEGRLARYLEAHELLVAEARSIEVVVPGIFGGGGGGDVE